MTNTNHYHQIFTHTVAKKTSKIQFRLNPFSAAMLLILGSTGGVNASSVDPSHIIATGVAEGKVNASGTRIGKTGGSTDGLTFEISNNQPHGSVVFNTFEKFHLGVNDAANLKSTESQVKTYVNLVNDAAKEKTVINGKLTSYVDGESGKGNVIFADPNGIMVGAKSVVNVGSLTMTVPNHRDMNCLTEQANKQSLSNQDANQLVVDLMAGKYVSKNVSEKEQRSVTVEGEINSRYSINIFSARDVIIGAEASLVAGKVFDSVVNSKLSGDSAQEAKAIIADDLIVGNAGLPGNSANQILIRAPHEIDIRATDKNHHAQLTVGPGTISLQADNSSSVPGVDTIIAATQAPEKNATNVQPFENKTGISLAEYASLSADDGSINLLALSSARQTEGIVNAGSLITLSGSLNAKDIHIQALSSTEISGNVIENMFSAVQIEDAKKYLKEKVGELSDYSDKDAKSFLYSQMKTLYAKGQDAGDRLSNLRDFNFSSLIDLIPLATGAKTTSTAKVDITASASLYAGQNLNIQARADRNIDTSSSTLMGLGDKLSKVLPFMPAVAYGQLSGESTVHVAGKAKLVAGKVNPDSGANLNPDANITINAISNNAMKLEASAQNDKDGKALGFAFSLAMSDFTNQILVDEDAVLKAGGDINLSTFTGQNIENSAEFKSSGEGAAGGPALALSLLSSTSKSQLDGKVTAAKNLSVNAVNLVYGQKNNASVSAGTDGSEGKPTPEQEAKAPVAPMLSWINGKLDKVKEKFAKSESAEQTGKEPAEQSAPAEKAGMTKLRAAATVSVSITKNDAMAIIGSKNRKNPAGQEITISGDLSLLAQQNQDSWHNSAISSVSASNEDKTKAALGVAVSYAELDQHTNTLIGDGVSISARRLGGGAFNRQTLDTSYFDVFKGLDKWSSVSDVLGKLEALKKAKELVTGNFDEAMQSITSNYANATVGSGDEAKGLDMSGNVVITNNDISSHLWLGDNTKITLNHGGTTDETWTVTPFANFKPDTKKPENEQLTALSEMKWEWKNTLDLKSHNTVEQLNIAGNFLSQLLAENDAKGKTAVGGNINIMIDGNQATAAIGKATIGQKITDAGKATTDKEATDDEGATDNGATDKQLKQIYSMNLSATQDESKLINLASAGGTGASIAAPGALVVNYVHSNAIAFMDNQATVHASTVNLDATHNMGLWSAAGAFGLAGDTSVGVTLVLNMLNTDIRAFAGALTASAGDLSIHPLTTGDDDLSKASDSGKSDAPGKASDSGISPAVKKTGLWDVTNLKVNAQSLGQSGAFTIAGAVAKSSEQKEKEHATSKEGDTAGSELTQAPPVIDSLLQALGMSIKNKQEEIQGSIHKVVETVKTVPEKIKGVKDQVNGFLAESAPMKSDKDSLSVAGSVSINQAMQKTRAWVDGIELKPGNSDGKSSVSILALNNTHQYSASGGGALTLAKKTGGNKSTAAGVAVALNDLGNTTTAELKNSIINNANTVSVAAVQGGDQISMGLGLAVAKGGKEKNTAVGVSPSVSSSHNTTKAIVDSSSIHVVSAAQNSGRMINVIAYDRTRQLIGGGDFALSLGGEEGGSAGGALALSVQKSVLESLWVNSQADHFASLSVRANSASKITAVAAGLSASTTEGGKSGQGSVSVVVMDNKVNAEISGNESRLDGDNLEVRASSQGSEQDQQEPELDEKFTGASENPAFDSKIITDQVNGDVDVNNTLLTDHTNDDAASYDPDKLEQDSKNGVADDPAGQTQKLPDADMSGEYVLAVAGSLTGGKGDAYGGGLNVIYANSEYHATLDNPGIIRLSKQLKVNANNATEIYSVAAAVAGGAGTAVSGTGSLVFGSGDVSAKINVAQDNSLPANNDMLTAGSLQLSALRSGQTFSLAGGITGSKKTATGAAFSVIDSKHQAHAGLSGAGKANSHIRITGLTDIRAGQSEHQIGLAISVSGSKDNALGGTLSLNIIDDDTSASVQDATLNTGGLAMNAGLPDARQDEAIIKSLSTVIAGSKKTGGGLSVGVNLVNARRSAILDQVALTTSGNIDMNSAFKGEIWGLAASLVGGGKLALGGSVLYNLIGGKTDAGAEDEHSNIQTLVRVNNSEINNNGTSPAIENLSMNANSGELSIYSLAGGISGGGKGAAGLGISVNEITAKRLAEITGSNISHINDISLSAAQKQKNFAIAVGGAGAGKFALGGSSATNTQSGTEQALIDNSVLEANSLKLNSSGGSRYIWSLGGAIAGAGKAAAGIANTNNLITAERNAIVRNSSLTLKKDLELLSGGDADIHSLAVGASGAGSAAAGASVAYNDIKGKEQSYLQNVIVEKVNKITIDVSKGKANIKTLAGNVAGGGSAAGAGAAAISTIGQKRYAAMDNSAIYASGDIVVKATTSGEIKTLSASGAIGGKGALALSNSTNTITSDTSAGTRNSSGMAQKVTIEAKNGAIIKALSGGVTGAGAGAAGIATAIDNIGSKTQAMITGSKTQAVSIDNKLVKQKFVDNSDRDGWLVTNLQLDAGTQNTIETIGISAAIGGVAAAGATVSLNNITSRTETAIYGKARVLAQHNVALDAHNNDSILGQNGAISGSGTIAVSGIASVNKLNSNTIARIGSQDSDNVASQESQAYVTALGRDDSDKLTITTAKPSEPEKKSDTGEAEKKSEISAPKEKSDINAALVKKAYNPFTKWKTGTEQITGLAVQASSVQSLGQMAASVAIAISPGLAGSALASNGVISGSTVASVNNARINQEDAGKAAAAQHVSVDATSYMLGSGYLASAAASTGVGVAGVLDSQTFTNKTQALVDNSTVSSKGDTRVNASGSQQVMSLLAGFGAGAVGGAANVSLIELQSTTLAQLTHSQVLDVASLSVKAAGKEHIIPIDATLSVGGVAAGGNVVVVNNDSATRAQVLGNGKNSAQMLSQGDASISAINLSEIDAKVAGISGGGVAVAASALIVHQNTDTRASLEDAKFTVNKGTLEVYAHDNVMNNAVIGSVSGGAVGAGASANVLIANSLASAGISNSDVLMNEGDVTVHALRDGDISLNTTAGALAGAAIGGSVGFIQLGDGALDLKDDQGNTYNPMSDLDNQGGTDDKAGTLTTADKLAKSGRVTVSDLKTWDAENGKWISDTDSSKTINDANAQAVSATEHSEGKTIHETSAEIAGGSITASENAVNVWSDDQLSSSNKAGTAVIGGVSVGAAVATTYSNARVSATVTPASMQVKSLDVRAVSQDKEDKKDKNKRVKAVTAYGISGSAGFVGIGAGVGVATMNNQLHTSLGGNIHLTGDLEVHTTDQQSLDVQAKGAQTGVAAAGLVLGIADHASIVTTQITDGADISANNLRIKSLSDAPVTLNGQGSSAGLGLALNAAVMVATDRSQAELKVGENARIQAQTLSLTSHVSPLLCADNQGNSLSVGAAAGAVLVNADLTAISKVSLGDNVRILAQTADIGSEIASDSDKATLHVEGYSVSAAGLAAVNAVTLNSVSKASSQLTTGNDDIFEGLKFNPDSPTNWHFFSKNNAVQTAKTSGDTGGGLLAGGSYSAALTQSGDTSTDVKGQFTGIINSLKVTASSDTGSYADVTAGQGGLVSGMASKATTSDTSKTVASLYTKDSNTGDTELIADHKVGLNSFVDSSNASLLGASGARANNNFNVTTTTTLADNSRLRARSYNQRAITTVNKLYADGKEKRPATNIEKPYVNGKVNINSGSGGLLDGSAGASTTTVLMNTTSNIGNNVDLHVVGDGGWDKNPQDLVIQAFNEVEGNDRVKLKSGGAVAIAKVDSAFTVNASATVNVNQSAQLSSVRDLILAASGLFNITSAAQSSTYGLAGAADGSAKGDVTAHYLVDIASGAKLFSYRNTSLNAGFDIDGSENTGKIIASTDLWNKTVIPMSEKPDGKAIYHRDSKVVLAKGTRVDSVQDIFIKSGKGIANLNGEGNATDLYKELLDKIGLAHKTHIVSNTDEGTAKVQLDGVLNSGAYHQRDITFENIIYKRDGKEITYDAMVKLLEELRGISIPQGTDQDFDGSNEPVIMQDKDESGRQIVLTEEQQKQKEQEREEQEERDKKAKQRKDELVLSYDIKTSKTSDKQADITFNQQLGQYSSLIDKRIEELEKALNNYDIVAESKLAFEGELHVLQNARQSLLRQAGAETLDEISVHVISLDPIIASPGNIEIIADPVGENGSYGTGELYAPASSSINIRNRSAAVLKTNDMAIPDHLGGQILLNHIKVRRKTEDEGGGFSANGFSGFSVFKDDASSPMSKISIDTSFLLPVGNKLHEVIPDLFIDGSLINRSGEVELKNAKGSIYIGKHGDKNNNGSNISALKVNISAGSNFVLDKEGFFHVGGDPSFKEITGLKGSAWKPTVQHMNECESWLCLPEIQLTSVKQPYSLPAKDGTLKFDTTDKMTKEQQQALVGDGAQGTRLNETSDTSGIVAGESLIIHAQYLNIKGLLQSGVDLWNLTIDDKAENLIEKIKKDTSDEAIKKLTWLDENLSKQPGSNLVEIQTQKVSEGRLGFSYDLEKDELVVDPINSGGGYMELTGKIFSTGNGRIKVLNGFSEVEINNKANIKLNIGGIDLGKGIEGHLRINDVMPDTNNPNKVVSTEYKYDGDNISVKTGVLGMTNEADNTFDSDSKKGFVSLGNHSSMTAYHPAEGLIYAGLTGTDYINKVEYVKTYYYKYFFKAHEKKFLYATVGPEKKIDAKFASLEENEYLAMSDSNRIAAFAKPDDVLVTMTTQETTGETEVLDKRLPFHCGFKLFGACMDTLRRADYLYYKNKGQRDVVNYRVRADSPISVEFIGKTAGKINVNTINDLLVSGSVYNNSGDTKLISQKGNIIQNEGAFFVSKNLTLNSAGNLGTAEQGLVINVVNNLSAKAGKEINIENRYNLTDNATNLLQLESGGNVRLKNQNDITAAPGTVIAGNAITLISGGSLGSKVQPLTFRMAESSDSSHYLLTAKGDKGVYLRQEKIQETHKPSDIWVNTIEATSGDVELTVQGALFDGRKSVAFDKRGLDQLEPLWSSMGLTGEEAIKNLDNQQAVLVNAHNSQYQRYWSNNKFNKEAVALTGEEIARLKESGRTQEQIVYEAQWRLDIGQNAYDENYNYQLSGADQKALTDTHDAWYQQYWTERNQAEPGAVTVQLIDPEMDKLQKAGWTPEQIEHEKQWRLDIANNAYDENYHYQIADIDQKSLVGEHNAYYRDYWQERNKRVFDAKAAQLTDQEIADMQKAGWTLEQIEHEKQWRVDIGQNPYNENYQYQLSQADQKIMADTASWTPDELQNSFANALSSRGARISAVIKDTNIIGNNISITASNVGRVDDDIEIDLTKGDKLTDAEKAALLAAQPDDIHLNDLTRVTVHQRSSFNVLQNPTAKDNKQSSSKTGSLNVIASDSQNGALFLNSQQGLRIDHLSAGYVEVVTDTGGIQAITPASGGYNIIASKQLSLVANSNGDIGSAANPLTTRLENNGLLHAEGHKVYINQDGSVQVNRLTGTDTLNLNIQGDLISAVQGVGENLLGGNVNLIVQGNAGSLDNPIQIGTAAESSDVDHNRITLDISKNAWIGGLQGKASENGILRISQANVGGALVINQLQTLEQSGEWHTGSLQLTADKDWIMEDGGNVMTAINAAKTTTGTISATLGGNWHMAVNSGITAAGNLHALVTGDAVLNSLQAAQATIQASRLQATTNNALWQTDQLLQLTTTYGDLGSGVNQPLLQASKINLSSVGELFSGLRGMTSGTINAGKQIGLTTLGNVTLDAVQSTGADIRLQSQQQATIADLIAAGDIRVTGDKLTATRNIQSGGAIIADALTGLLKLATVSADRLITNSDALEITDAQITHDIDLQALHNMQITTAISHQGKFSARADNISFDNLQSKTDILQLITDSENRQQGNIHGKLASAAGNLSINASGNIILDGMIADAGEHSEAQATENTLDAGHDLRLTSGKTITVNGISRAAHDVIMQAGAMVLDTLQSGNNSLLISSASATNSGDIQVSDSSSDADQIWQADGNIQLQQLDAAGETRLTAGKKLTVVQQAISKNKLSALAEDIQFNRMESQQDNLELESNGDVTQDHGNIIGQVARAEVDMSLIATGHLNIANLDYQGELALKSGRDLILKTPKKLSIEGGLQSERDINIASGQQLDLDMAEAGRDLSLESDGQITITRGLLSGGVINVIANDANINLAGDTESVATGSAGDITLKGNNISARLIKTSGGGIIASGHEINATDLQASGLINLQSSGLVKFDNSSSGGDQQIQAAGDIQAQDIKAGGSARFTSAAKIALAELHAGRNVQLTANQLISLGNGVAARGLIHLLANNGDIHVAGNTRSAGSGDITMRGNHIITRMINASGGNIAVNSQSFNTEDLHASGTINLQASGNIHTQNSVSGGDQQWQSGGDIKAQTVRSAGSVTLGATGAMMLDSLDTGGNMSLQAQRAITVSDRSQSGGDQQWQSGGDIKAQAIQAGGSVTLGATGAMMLANLDTGGNISLQAQGAIHVLNRSQSGGDQQWRSGQDIVADSLLAQGQALLDSLLNTRINTLKTQSQVTMNAGWRNSNPGAGSIYLQQLQATDVNLSAGQDIQVDNAQTGQNLHLFGQNIGFKGEYTGDSDWQLWINGSGEPATRKLNLQVSASRIRFNQFNVTESNIKSTSSDVSIEQATNVGLMNLDTPDGRLFMNNLSPAYEKGADVQFYQTSKTFWIKQDGKVTTSNAMMIHRNTDNQILLTHVASFSDGLKEDKFDQNNAVSHYIEQKLSSLFMDMPALSLSSDLATSPLMPAALNLQGHFPATPVTGFSADHALTQLIKTAVNQDINQRELLFTQHVQLNPPSAISQAPLINQPLPVQQAVPVNQTILTAPEQNNQAASQRSQTTDQDDQLNAQDNQTRRADDWIL